MEMITARRIVFACIVVVTTLAGCKPKSSNSLVDNAGGRKPEDFPELGDGETTIETFGVQTLASRVAAQCRPVISQRC